MNQSQQVIRLEPNFHDHQKRIYDSKARFKVVRAGRRGGKTYLICWDAIIFALQNANSLLWYLAPTYGQAKAIFWRRLLATVPKAAVHKIHETELYIQLVNGAVIELKGCDNENSLRGRAPNRVYLDETAFMKQHIWEEIIRPSLIDNRGGGYLIGTPNGKNWFWKLWQEASIGLDKSFEAFHFTTFDNPHLPPEELDIAKKQIKNSVTFRQELMGEAASFEGLVYPEFFKDIHVVPAFKLPKEARIFRGIDWGIQAPCVCLWGALMPSGEVFIYREHYRPGLPAPRQAQIIKSMSTEEVEATVIDPSTRRRESKDQDGYSQFESIQMQFLRAGVPTVPGFNKIMDGISVVKELFIDNKLFIFETCPNLITELLTYEWANASEGEEAVANDKPKDGGDDGCDALKYMLCHIVGKSRNPIDRPPRNATVAEGSFLVDYNDEGNVSKIRPRKIPPWERNGHGTNINEYGGING